jgi:hypothetical protein
METPVQQARDIADAFLSASRVMSDVAHVNIRAPRGGAVREPSLQAGHGCADYLLYASGQAAGVITARRQGLTLNKAGTSTTRYPVDLPDRLPAWQWLLPRTYQSNGIETRFATACFQSRARAPCAPATALKRTASSCMLVSFCRPLQYCSALDLQERRSAPSLLAGAGAKRPLRRRRRARARMGGAVQGHRLAGAHPHPSPLPSRGRGP